MSEHEPAPRLEPNIETAAHDEDGIEASLSAMEGELRDLTHLVRSEGESAAPIAEAVDDEAAFADLTPNEAAEPMPIDTAPDEVASTDAEVSWADDVEASSTATQPSRTAEDDDRVTAGADEMADGLGETTQDEPEPEMTVPPDAREEGSPLSADPDYSDATNRIDGSAHEDEPSALDPPVPATSSRSRRRRRQCGTARAAYPPVDEVASALDSLAAFLDEHVSTLWEQARDATERILADESDAASAKTKVDRLYKEMQGMRDELNKARRESRLLQVQLQNLRDEATRARQRADTAANDAQNAADRAAAAAREAETAASFSDDA